MTAKKDSDCSTGASRCSDATEGIGPGEPARSEALLPCPFCGGPARLSNRQDESLWSHELVDWYSASCLDCDIEMTECDDFDGLRKAWNTRAGQPSASSEVE